MRSQRRFRRRDRGFSLLIVFLLILVMVGAAAGVMLSTQEDLSVAGQDRESLQAFYAAEYAVAQAKDWLTNQGIAAYAGSWTPLLSSGSNYLCQPTPTVPPTGPGKTAKTANAWQEFEAGTGSSTMTNPFYVSGNSSGGVKVQWRWCVHNDDADPAYLNSGAGVNGDTNDTDASTLITIEGFGQIIPTAANSNPLASGHVWVTVGKPANAGGGGVNCYAQPQGCGSHSGNGGAAEANISVVLTGTPRGL